MTKNRLAFEGIIACLLVSLASRGSTAQERPPIDLSGGYQYVFDIPAEQSVPHGWFVSAGWNATSWLAVVGEFTNSARTFDADRFEIFTTMGGVRLRKGGFFGQFLVGQFALRNHETRSDGSRLEQTLTDTVIQPGVGWDIGITRRVSARIQVDYRQLLSDEDRFGRELRVAAGVAVGLGSF